MATILVVDDEPAVLALAAKILKGAGHGVLCAGNGVQGLMIYESYASQIELVVTDIEMPGMNGLELAARVSGSHPGVRVLLISGFVRPELRDTAERYPLLAKPFRPAALVAAVQTALES
jgi:CheY-like chemotaxis protein